MAEYFLPYVDNLIADEGLYLNVLGIMDVFYALENQGMTQLTPQEIRRIFNIITTGINSENKRTLENERNKE